MLGQIRRAHVPGLGAREREKVVEEGCPLPREPGLHGLGSTELKLQFPSVFCVRAFTVMGFTLVLRAA